MREFQQYIFISLLGTKNDYEKLNDPSKYRAINRYQWQKKNLYKQLNDPGSENHNILNRLNHLLSIRSKQKAFHPNATQFTLDLGDIFLVFGGKTTNVSRVFLYT